MAYIKNIFNIDNGYYEGSVANGTATKVDSTPEDGSTCSLKLVGTTSSDECTWTSSKSYTLDKTHTYYFAAKVYYPSSVNGSFDFYWPIAEPAALTGVTVSKAKTWQKVSGVFTRNSSNFTSGSQVCRFDYNNAKSTVNVYVSGMTLVDLTDAFGSGNEPDKDWCDTVLPFIDKHGFYSTLVEVFTATADSIRSVYDTTDKITPSQFPDKIEHMLFCPMTSSKIKSDLYGTSYKKLSNKYTPDCACYYGGYYWIGGHLLDNDSQSNTVYISYSTNGTSWTTVTAYEGTINALGFDLDNNYVYAFGSLPSSYSSYSCYRLKNIFDSDNMTYNTYNFSCAYTDAVSSGSYIWALNGTQNTVYIYGADTFERMTHSSISHNYYRCCLYNKYPVGISDDGYYMYKSSISSKYAGGEFLIDTDFTSCIVAQIGDYLGVVGTKNGGTYLYYAKGTPGSLEFTSLLLVPYEVTPIGLMYANGLYTMIYRYSSHTYIWGSETLDNSFGGGGIQIQSLSNYPIVAAFNNDSKVHVAANQGGYPSLLTYTVP